MPTATRRMLARKGRRQPHDIRSSRGSGVTSAKAPAASRLPIDTPSGAKLPQKPRRCGRRILDQIDHRAAIFGARAQSLDDAHQHQQKRRPIADLGEGRQHADQRSCRCRSSGALRPARACAHSGRRARRTGCRRAAAPRSRRRRSGTPAACRRPGRPSGRTIRRTPARRRCRRERSRTIRARTRCRPQRSRAGVATSLYRQCSPSWFPPGCFVVIVF